MSKNAILVLYGVLMVAVVVAMDLLFFRYQIERRLIANVATVLLFVIVYVVFLRPRGKATH